MNPSRNSNIVLTGLARSGTTLTCYLLNLLPNIVALHEPMQPSALAPSPAQVPDHVQAFFEAQRRLTLQTGRATSKAQDGRVPMNSLSDEISGGQRRSKLNGSAIVVDKVVDENFTLCIKHPSFFTATLPALVERFPCFATVRNPLSVLLSWRDSGLPVSRGRVPAAERFDPALKASLDAEPNVLERQLLILAYFFQRYADHLPDRTIRYENTIETGGRALSPINPAAETLDVPFAGRNARRVGEDGGAQSIAAELLRRDGPWWYFYAPEEVEALLG